MNDLGIKCIADKVLSRLRCVLRWYPGSKSFGIFDKIDLPETSYNISFVIEVIAVGFANWT